MLSQCANPECAAPFHYLREGKLFRVEKEAPPSTDTNGLYLVASSKPVKRIEHFWLCGTCSTKLTLVLGSDGMVTVIPIKKSANNTQHAAAS